MEVGEGNQLIAQVEIGHAALMQMLSNVSTEIHCLSTIDNEDWNYDQMLMQHPLFNKNQTWYLGRKPKGTPCRCSGCLNSRIVQSNDLHFYVQGLLFLPKEQKVVDTKLRFCLSARCTNGITSANNNIKPLLNQEVLIHPRLNAISAREKGSILRQIVNIAWSILLDITKLDNNGVEVLISFDGDHSFVYDYLYS